MSKVLGIDIGINNVGYGLIEKESGEILKAGVRSFTEANKNANQERREKRCLRRQIRRRKHRLDRVKECLVKYGFPIDKLSNNPYEIRKRAIYEQVEPWKIAVALLHIAKRRGTTLDVPNDLPAKNNELSTKEQIKRNDEAVKSKYICEVQLENLSKGGVRNHTNKFRFQDYEKEVVAILNNQNQYYEEVNQEFIDEYLSLLNSRRMYYDGPGSEKSPTPYGQFFYDESGKLQHIGMIEKMKGKCTFFPNENRIAKMSYIADLFNMLNDLNNITFNGENLSTEDKKYLISEYVDKGNNLTPSKLIKYLKNHYEDVEEATVSGFRIDLKNKKDILTEFKGYNLIKKYSEAYNLPTIIYEDKILVDEIIEILTSYKDYENRTSKLTDLLSEYVDSDNCTKIINVLKEDTEFKGYHSLSRVAIESIIDDLWTTNYNQMQLFTEKGFFDRKTTAIKGKNIKFDDEAILSPVAKRAHREAIKIINKIREEYGELDGIVIEMAREKNSDEQKEIEKKLQKNQGDFEKYLAQQFDTKDLKSLKLSSKQMTALKLLQQQDNKCIYTHKPITPYDIKDKFYLFEIDHIVPISVSFDDSLNNKVLCYAKANQDKGQRTPFQYYSLGECEITYSVFKAEALRLYKGNKRKLANLLEERDIKYNPEIRKEFINRNLVDTRYAARSLMLTLKDYFKANDINTKVYSIRGGFTSAFRKAAGIKKDRDESYRHHAVDALIVASMTKIPSFSQIKKYTLAKDRVVDKETGEIMSKDEFFDKKTLRYINSLNSYNNFKFSHKVDRKVNRAIIGRQTIYGTKKKGGEEFIVNKYSDIYSLSKKECKKLIDDLQKEPEKFFIYENNPDVYNLLIKIANEYKNTENPFLAYKNEYGYVLKDGKIPVKALRYYEKRLGVHLDISNKYINPKNKVVMLEMQYLRIDVYKNHKGYKYVALPYMEFLPNRKEFSISEERYNQLKEKAKLDTSCSFCFSLYKYDTFSYKVKDKSGAIIENKVIFIGANRPKDNIIEFDFIDKRREKQGDVLKSLGTFIEMTKFNVNVLGDEYIIKI